jgi:hypothetical protein
LLNRLTNSAFIIDGLLFCCGLPADLSVSSSNGLQLTFGAGPGLPFAGNDRLEELHLPGHIMNGFNSGTLWPSPLNTMPRLRVLHLSGPGPAGVRLPDMAGSMSQLQSLWLLNMSNIQGGPAPGPLSTYTHLLKHLAALVKKMRTHLQNIVFEMWLSCLLAAVLAVAAHGLQTPCSQASA